ncbi:putative magnesium transporter NIPA2 [Bienertia sinuspersici]
MGMSSDNVKGLVLAVSSSVFIGSSFIIKKKGLMKAGSTGTRAGSGGHSYLYEPWWWAGMIAMIVGEIANFAAYAFAPAILVTPLGALSIIFSSVLAHFILKEKLHIFGVLGCVLCVVGSTTIVLHAPHERDIESVRQVWHLATEPGFLVYAGIVILLVLVLIFYYVPRNGRTHMIVYIGICSLMGSLTVMCVKAVSIALKLTFEGNNQFKYFQAWFFTIVVVVCCILQINYLNKIRETWDVRTNRDLVRSSPITKQTRPRTLRFANQIVDGCVPDLFFLCHKPESSDSASHLAALVSTRNPTGRGKEKVDSAFSKKKALDTFNTAVVSPVYYVMFTSLTILASMIMFKDWDSQNGSQIATELCGFVTILSGTFLLHKTKDMGNTPALPLPAAELTRHLSNCGHDNSRHSSRNASPDRNFRE